MLNSNIELQVLVNIPFQSPIIGIDPPVAEEEYDAADIFGSLFVDPLQHSLAPTLGAPVEEPALRLQYKALPPELDAAGHLTQSGS